MPHGSSVVASVAEHRHYYQDHWHGYQAVGKQLDHATHLRLVGAGSLRHPLSASNRNHSAKSRWILRASSNRHVSARCECSAAFALYSARFNTTHPLCSGSGPVNRFLRQPSAWQNPGEQPGSRLPTATKRGYEKRQVGALLIYPIYGKCRAPGICPVGAVCSLGFPGHYRR